MNEIFIIGLGLGIGYFYANYTEEKEIEEIKEFIETLPKEEKDNFYRNIGIATGTVIGLAILVALIKPIRKKYYKYKLKKMSDKIDILKYKEEEEVSTHEESVELSKLEKDFPKIQKIFYQLNDNIYVDLN